MKWLIWAIAIFILMVLNAGIFSQFYFLPFLPGLLVVFIAILLMLEDKREWLVLTVISGVLMDFASGLPDGVLLSSLIAAGGAVYFLTSRLVNREYGWVILFATSAVMSLLYFVFSLAVAKLFDLFGLETNIDYAYFFAHKILWYIVINLVLTYPVYLYYLLVKKLIVRTQTRE